jgi:signal transduction histidine kinase/DNA-binding response OmpR family regulator/ligand-binding sensor domain-containing protein
MQRLAPILGLLTLLVAASGHASTLSHNPAAPGYVQETFSVDDGLPSGGLNQVLQTRDGYLWLATFDGLVRYDGVRFKTFQSIEHPALRNSRIASLAEDGDGTLWITLDRYYLVRYREGRFTACGPTPEGLSCALPQSTAKDFMLYSDPDGTPWIVWQGRIYRVDSEDPVPREVFRFPTTGPDAARSLAALTDPQGRLWILTQDGLWRSGAAPRVQAHRFERIGPMVDSLGVDDQGTLWWGTTKDEGSSHRDAIGQIRVGERDPKRIVLRRDLGIWIAEDRRGGLFFSTTDGRLYRMFEGEPRLIAEDPQPPGWPKLRYVESVMTADGSVWTAWSRFLLLGATPVLETSEAHFMPSVTLGRRGTVWATGSAAGALYAFHPVRLENLSAGLPNPEVTQIYEDLDGTLWTGGRYLGAMAPGASSFELLASMQYPLSAILRGRDGALRVAFGWWSPSSEVLEIAVGVLPGETIATLFESATGELWAGGARGLFHRQESGRWSLVEPVAGKPIPELVRQIHQTSDGALWLASNGDGLVRLLKGRTTVIDQRRGLASDHLRSIWIAPEGHLWISTDASGLSRLDPTSLNDPEGARIVNLDRRHGLYADGIHQIVDDELGNLWMSSNDGIFRVRRDELEAVADAVAAGAAATDPEAQLISVAYDERDGMDNREANGGSQRAGLRDRQGRILFPTMGGVVRLDPRKLTEGIDPPTVDLEELQWTNGSRRSLQSPGALQLAPQERSFTVTYTAPYFRAADRLRFRYRLTPYDEAWIDVGARREAPYTQVPPGSYTFEVMVNHEGVWSEPATFSLDVAPRFFETGWFHALEFLLAGALIFTWVRWREHQGQVRRRELEQEVRTRTRVIGEQAEKLRHLDVLKSQFFANVSHEFRTPLTLVLGPLRDALDGSFGDLREDLTHELRVAEGNAERLLGLVEQLLDVARLEAGGFKLRLQRVDLRDCLRLCVETHQPLAERLRLRIDLHLPSAAAFLICDPTQLGKVFDNLLVNALKFSPEGESVEVSLDVSRETGPLQVRVRDRGPGIPEEQRERIFERFYQVDPSETRPGAGLGLALARQLTELHGGTLSASGCGEGPGALFTATLPPDTAHFDPALLAAEEPEDGALGEAPPAGPPGKDILGSPEGPLVLIVDDNAEIRAYLRRHLGAVYEVVEAADGEDALAQARARPPALVISDLMMPGLDGKELFHALRAEPKLETIPVILVTAKASAQSRIEGLREGLDDYLVKPFDPRELLARAANLIAARQHLEASRGLRISANGATSADQSFLEKVQTAIEERMANQDLTVEEVAAAVGCERSYLLRRLRALVDQTPSGLIRTLRLQRAAQLLGSDAGTVSEIATQVGFKSVSHFSTAFLKHFKERPKAYAERHRKSP